MKKCKKFSTWINLMTKKMLCRWSYLIILALIPLFVCTLNKFIDNPNGVVKVALCVTPGSGELAHSVADELVSDESIVKFEIFSNEKKAVDAVKSNECDAAWVFDENFESGMNAYIEKKSIRPFVKVYEKDNGIYLTLSREKLNGKLFSHIATMVCENFMREEFELGKAVSEDKLHEYFENEKTNETLVEIKMTGSEKIKTDEINYLKSPLSGILALLVMLCGFASVAFFLKERHDGIYDQMNSKMEMFPAFASCFGAIGVAAIAVLISKLFGGFCNDLPSQIFSMAAYVFAATSFCVFLTGCFSSFSFFGPFIPFMMLLMLIICPVFFSFRFLPLIKFLMPPYYYLVSLYNSEYVWYMIGYGICFMFFSKVIYSLKKE